MNIALSLQEHMTKDLITIKARTTVAEAHRLMTNFWIRHLPVLNESGDAIVGMISERDLLRSPSPDTPVELLMSSPLKTFSIDTPLMDVVEAMIDEKISAFLITKDETIAGIVTTEDLLIVLAQLLQEEPHRAWAVSEILVNPSLQRAAYIIGQTGL